MLSQVSVNQKNENTCVEELGVEYSISDGWKLLTHRVLSDPGYQCYYAHFQNKVHSNNDEWDGGS